jgi:uncharacterized protein (TIGR02145 family)
MKKLKLFLNILSLILFFGCSINPDGNTTVVPLPPTFLSGDVASKTQINLSWMDNSTNEIGFKIERKTGAGNYVIVGTTDLDITNFSDNGLTSGTTYVYRVYSYNSAGISLSYTDELTITTHNIPTLTTIATSGITATNAMSGGAITSIGGQDVSESGVVWSVNSNPTIALSTKTRGQGTFGASVQTISVLAANTKYYVRAYATNSAGTAYGNELNFTTLPLNVVGPNVTDIDGNVYQTVTIGNQTWTKSNLNVSKYRNGDVIPQVTDPFDWAHLKSGAWCYYENKTLNGTTYGKLYNWYAMTDPRGLAPVGYHIPTDAEWTTLTYCLSGNGFMMKETGTERWLTPNTGATNYSGFTGLPGGFRGTDGKFNGISQRGDWWSSTKLPEQYPKTRTVVYDNTWVANYFSQVESGLSLRCLRN